MVRQVPSGNRPNHYFYTAGKAAVWLHVTYHRHSSPLTVFDASQNSLPGVA